MAIPDSSSTTTSLSFPAQHYAKISPLSFLHSTLSTSSPPLRPNGRHPTQTRSPTINTSSLTNANGSAVIRLGSTSVVCGVRTELLPATHIHGGLPRELENWDGPEATSSNLPDARSDADLITELNLLVPNLELNTGCSPAHIPGNAPSAEAQSLTQRMLALLRVSDLVSLRQLLVWEERNPATDEDAMATDNPNNAEDVVGAGVDADATPRFQLRAIWTLYIDILYISLDGSAFAAGWLALLAALKDTRIPAAHWDEEREMVLCSSAKGDAKELERRALAVPLSAMLIKHVEGEEVNNWTLFDADDFEEALAEGEVTVVVVRKKEGKRVAKAGDMRLLKMEAVGAVPSAQELKGLVEEAGRRLEEWSEALRW